MKKEVDDFIKDHTHINYCEAIIYPDGTVEYVKPSHVETMIRFTEEDREVIYEKMPIMDSPIHWLTDYTKCIPVWSNGYILPDTIFTISQAASLVALINSGLVAENSMR